MAKTEAAQVEKLAVNPEELTLGELCELEEIVAQPAFVAMSSMSAKTIRAIVYLLKKREDPTYTFDQTADLRVSDVEFAAND